MRGKIFLKSIRFKNFKSYKDTQEAGPCHPKINTIIGPNGSGKSNFLDAILFVLGKRAGQIRFKKLSDLINLDNLFLNKFSNVSLIFQKSLKNYFEKIVIHDEIILSRQVFLNNSSIYYLNGKEISFTMLSQSSKTFGISTKNDRFLIQQGEIEKISTMKFKNEISDEIGLLEYSEDSFGSSRYIKGINKNKKKVLEVIKIIKRKKNFLKKKVLSFFDKKPKTIYKKKFKTLDFLKLFNLKKGMTILCSKIKKKEKEIKIENFWKIFNCKVQRFDKNIKNCEKGFQILTFKFFKKKKNFFFFRKIVFVF